MDCMLFTEESGPSTKRRKSNEDGEGNDQVLLAVNEQLLPDILKLDTDCFEALFDYLSLADLRSIGATCKQLQRIAGHCFRQNYKAQEAYYYCDKLYVKQVNVLGFIDFVGKVMIDDSYFDDDLSDSDEENGQGETIAVKRKSDHIDIRWLCFSQFESLRQLRLCNVVLAANNIERMKDILAELQYLQVFHCEVDNSFFGTVLVHCRNLKCLCVDEWTLNQVPDDWFHQSYPTLEHLELILHRQAEMPGLKSFFERNPAVRTFAITKNGLWLNRAVITNTNVCLDILAVDYDQGVDLDDFCEFLNELYDRGVYKNLHFYFGYSLLDQKIVNRLASLKALTKLRAKTDTQHITLSAFVHLQELCISNSSLVADLKSLPHILTNLNRIYFGEASSDDMLPFIAGSVTLSRINVLSLLTGNHFDQHEGVLDLAALDRQRKRLQEARKITIYVDERVYLATKRAMKRTDFDLIRVARADSYEWNHEFACDSCKFDR